MKINYHWLYLKPKLYSIHSIMFAEYGTIGGNYPDEFRNWWRVIKVVHFKKGTPNDFGPGVSLL